MNKTLNIFKERIKIALKENKEYKLNFYSLLIFDLIVISKYFLTLNIMKSVLGDIFTWNKVDYIIFTILLILSAKFAHDFATKNLFKRIQNGELNIGLSKPVNPFIYQIQNNIHGDGIGTTIFFIIIVTLISLYYKYFNIYGILFLVVGVIYYLIFTNFTESFNFFIPNNYIGNLSKKMDRYNRTFTPKSFENANFEWIFMILPCAISAYLTIEINKGNFTKLIEYQYIIFILCIFMILTTYFLWKIGLKKYKAYN